MAAPILPLLATEPMRLMQEAGLRHRATPVTRTVVRQPNGEYVVTWVPGIETCALFVVGNSDTLEIAAAHGVAATGILKLPRGTRPDVGQHYIVRGTLLGTCEPWERTLKVTADLSEDTERVVRRLLVVETVLDTKPPAA